MMVALELEEEVVLVVAEQELQVVPVVVLVKVVMEAME
tara:strand:- start:38 stop:151 length:114 start_codon:yes stop_codon:yes gene_type:complete